MRSASIRDTRTLGHVLAELRADAGLSQRELADRLGVSQRYIVELEQGKDVKALDRAFAVLRATGGRLIIELGDEGG